MVPSCSNCLLSSFPTTGKVHGYLARAVKVRGQTPKVSESIGSGVWILFFSGTAKPKPWALALFGFFVIGNEPEGRPRRGNPGLIIPPFSQVAKQEKKKKKTGRAKRRMQYNRRFVNVVPTFGKKKGPNANS